FVGTAAFLLLLLVPHAMASVAAPSTIPAKSTGDPLLWCMNHTPPVYTRLICWHGISTVCSRSHLQMLAVRPRVPAPALSRKIYAALVVTNDTLAPNSEQVPMAVR